MLTTQQINYFKLFGYLVIRGAYKHDIEAFSQAFDEVFEDPDQFRMDTDSTPYVRGKREVVPAIIDQHPTLQKLSDDSQLTAIADSLLSCEYTFLKGDGSRFHTQNTTWHVDAYTNPKHKSTHIKMALYLEPLTGKNGALRVIPGSHNDSDTYTASLRELVTSEENPPTSTIGVEGQDVPCVAISTEPGDLIVWNRRIAHASYCSNAPRRVITFGFRAAIGH